MTEMKTLNGYEIVDAAARERISKLEKAMEEFLGQSGEDSFTPITLTSGTLTDVQSGATQVKLSGTCRGYMSGGIVYFVFVNANNEIISTYRMANGTDGDVFNINVSLGIPSEAVKCGVRSDCSTGDSYVVDEYVSCELTLEFANVNIDESIVGTWYIENFDNLPDGTYTLNFSFIDDSDTIVQCTAIKKETYDSSMYVVSYEGYSMGIYDSGYGGYVTTAGSTITISDTPDDLSANFTNWLKSDAVKQ